MAEMYECNIVPTRAGKQHWTESKFSFMSTPRPDYGIMLLINGYIDFVTLSGEKIQAKAGDVIFLPKNAYYEANFRIDMGDIDDYLINFEADKKFSDYENPVLLASGVSFFCADLFREIVEESYEEKHSLLRRKGLFYLLLDRVLREKDMLHNNTDLILKAKELLESQDELSIGAIARECCVSESKLRKSFKASLGITPLQYRLNKKIAKAKYLLESTDLSVNEISEELRFFDVAYFSKMFCKYVGMPPRKYAKNKKL